MMDAVESSLRRAAPVQVTFHETAPTTPRAYAVLPPVPPLVPVPMGSQERVQEILREFGFTRQDFVPG
jgi:hypothetical protein